MFTFWLPAWSDIYGRKKFFVFAVAADMALLVSIMFTKSWAVVYVVGFLLGAVTSLRIQVGFNYLIEFYPVKYQTAAGVAYCVADGLVYMIATLFFWKISRDWEMYWLFPLIINGISTIGVFFMPESTRILVRQGRITEAVETFKMIARLNKS